MSRIGRRRRGGGKALPFGAFGAVWGRARVVASVNRPLRRIYSVPHRACVGDFHRSSPARWAPCASGCSWSSTACWAFR
eukprot:7113506-Pyramimonas_sp.AAC.1